MQRMNASRSLAAGSAYCLPLVRPAPNFCFYANSFGLAESKSTRSYAIRGARAHTYSVPGILAGGNWTPKRSRNFQSRRVLVSILVTGVAGFIGFHVAKRLAERGEAVLGVDNLNDFYDPMLKEARLRELAQLAGFTFRRVDIAEPSGLDEAARGMEIETVIHLAAQPGIRNADPRAHVRDNLLGQIEVLEFCRLRSVGHFLHASTSAVYGANRKLPYAEGDRVDDPLSVYAATKRGGELLSRTYSALHQLPVTSLRFFTIYGPWGRPDMAAWLFADAILAGRPVRLHGHGKMRRSFTYIDDLVDGVLRASDRVPGSDRSGARHAVYNLGDPGSVDLERFVSVLETAIGRRATREHVEGAPGEVELTAADIRLAEKDLGFRPRVSIEEGLRHFVDWLRQYREEAVEG